jgi:galactan 5-O-arabinofuranosyltransferase
MVVEHVAVEAADQVLPEADGQPVPDEIKPPEEPARPRAWRRAVLVLVEVAAAIVPAMLFLLWARNINVDPLTRVGQVSGLAALQFRFALVSIALVTALIVVQRFGPAGWHYAATRIGCAVAAGMATALVAGGSAVAVRHTPWALWANGGDNHWIMDWAHTLLSGKKIPNYYPPLSIWTLTGWSKLSGKPPEYALQQIQLVGAALYGPAAYLAWRLTLRPVWALGIGVVACLPFIEPIKPYTQITLVMLIPVLVKFLHTVRHAGRLSMLRAGLLGLVFGAGIGVLFLLYSGWFVWGALGILVAFLVVTPWRTALGRVAVLGATTLVTFLAVSWVHLSGLLNNSGGTSDKYFYFDTNTEPAYIAMWRNDRGVGAGPVWPPFGELGGVGLFTILLAIGAGVAIYFGWRRTVVLTLGCVAVSAWLMRMYLASESYATLSVRLYPRTLMIILYCLLLLTGFAVYYAVTWLRSRSQPLSLEQLSLEPVSRAERWRAKPPLGLMLIPLLFFFASAGSATSDRYMPQSAQGSMGYFTWIAQSHRLLDGGCPQYARLHGCQPRPIAKASPGSSPSPSSTPRPSGTAKPSGSAKPTVSSSPTR